MRVSRLPPKAGGQPPMFEALIVGKKNDSCKKRSPIIVESLAPEMSRIGFPARLPDGACEKAIINARLGHFFGRDYGSW